jgi:hypothetical protein
MFHPGELRAARPKYDHPGKTRNGFGQADRMETIKLEKCPICQRIVNIVETEPVKVQQWYITPCKSLLGVTEKIYVTSRHESNPEKVKKEYKKQRNHIYSV